MNSYIKYRNKRWRPKPQLSFSARKAKRQPYTGSKRFDKSCRSHGSCGWCEGGRKHVKARQTPIAEWELVGIEKVALDQWNTYADPWDWGTVEEMQWDRHCELSRNERELHQLDCNPYHYNPYNDLCAYERHYYGDWDDDPWDMWDPYEEEDWHRNELSIPWEGYVNYIDYTNWVDPNSWRREFNGLEEDHIMEIINNRLNTAEALKCHTLAS